MESISARRSSCCCGYDACDNDGDMCPNIWSKLPVDLIIEFLRPLPKESLLRFRLISKAHNFIISGRFLPKLATSATVSRFVFQWEKTVYRRMEYKRRNGTYRRFCPPPTPFYGYVNEPGRNFNERGGKLVESYLKLLPFEPKTDDFLGCFNGFFLVRNSSSVPIHYYVCNPATKQCLAIPTNPAHSQKDSFAGLAFDQLVPPPHNFKIIRVDCSHEMSSSVDHKLWEMDVFSSATGKWVNHTIPLEPGILEFQWNRRSIYFDGVFYMLSMDKYLLCFDLDTANDNTLKARVVKLPPKPRDDCVGLFEASNGCLYYACKVDNHLMVWTFQAGNEASLWTLKYDIEISASQHESLSTPCLGKQTVIFAVDLSAEVIYAGSAYWAYIYDTKNNKANFYGLINYGNILYATSLCFYPYSCFLVRLSEHFS